jgi:hypothetical protein
MAATKNDLGRNIIWQSGWMDRLDCEVCLFIGRDDHGFYYALEISPDHDDQPMGWRGSWPTEEIAKDHGAAALERWEIWHAEGVDEYVEPTYTSTEVEQMLRRSKRLWFYFGVIAATIVDLCLMLALKH